MGHENVQVLVGKGQREARVTLDSLTGCHHQLQQDGGGDL